jgi:hypothetical protein
VLLGARARLLLPQADAAAQPRTEALPQPLPPQLAVSLPPVPWRRLRW